ncbi:MAG: M6 family metalloprotease domain-containing protein, partial [Planctomycetota bacterium]
MTGRTTSILGGLALMLLFAGIGRSAPHEGDVFSLMQPDGTQADVRVFGDEFYQRVESTDGYSLIRDAETGWICYAEVARGGEDFVSTGVIYRGIAVEDWGDSKEKQKIIKLAKGLKLKKEAIVKKAKAKREELLEGQEPEKPVKALEGSLVGLTILIQFPDQMGTISREDVNDYCNMVGYDGYGNNGSVRDYFYDVSNQMLIYTNYVTEYYTAQNDKSYYDNCSGGRTRDLLSEALNWLDDQGFDFSILSRTSSNRIEALNIFYAGSPSCGWSNGLWPHKGYYGGFTSDSGVRSGDYQITNIGSQLRLGTFCHENGHMICSWPDLYDYGYESRGIGSFGLMASSGGRNPRPPNPHFRDLRGWETIIEINDDAPATVRYHQANSFTTYRYSHPTNEREFFLVESRLKDGRHEGMPDEGMLIWHVDRDGSNNNEQMTPQQHYRVSVEQADGLFHLERDRNGGGGGDMFHAGDNDSFDDYTLPDARWWDGTESGMRIHSISAISANMSFTVDNIPIDLMVAPGAPVELRGLTGGPFAPSSAVYTSTNFGDSAINCTVSSTAAWLSAPVGVGTLAPGESTMVDISLTGVADTLQPGTYSDIVVFTDITNGAVREREVKLIVESKELVAHWKLEETSGTTIGDSAGNGHAGELLGSDFGSSSQTGKFGQGVDLDGEDDTLYFEGFHLPRPFFSTSFWFKPDSDMAAGNGRKDLFYWDSGGHLHISFDKDGGGKIGIFMELGGTEYQNMKTTTTSWSASAWHNILFTFDASDFQVYVDGVLENTINHPGIPDDTYDP